MKNLTLRDMNTSDMLEGAELISLSHSTWSRMHAMPTPFGNIPASADFYFNLYGALDGGHGIVAENSSARRLAGLCFYHVRSSHVSVGTMSVHPNYFQCGVGKVHGPTGARDKRYAA